VKTLLRWLSCAWLLTLAIQARSAEGWDWNPFNNDGKTPSKNVSMTRTTLINGRKISSPVSQQWRSTPPGMKPPSPAKKAMSGAADMITFKPLREKLVGPSASNWSTKPPSQSAARTSKNAKPSFMSSLFKPAPPKPPQTMQEWMNQPSPKF
jgi:hypothetical protein